MQHCKKRLAIPPPLPAEMALTFFYSERPVICAGCKNLYSIRLYWLVDVTYLHTVCWWYIFYTKFLIYDIWYIEFWIWRNDLDPSLPYVHEINKNIFESMDQISIKTPNPKCRLYWCLIEFVDWKYVQSVMLVFSTPLVTYSVPLTFSLVHYPPPPCVNKYRGMYSYSV